MSRHVAILDSIIVAMITLLAIGATVLFVLVLGLAIYVITALFPLIAMVTGAGFVALIYIFLVSCKHAARILSRATRLAPPLQIPGLCVFQARTRRPRFYPLNKKQIRHADYEAFPRLRRMRESVVDLARKMDAQPFTRINVISGYGLSTLIYGGERVLFIGVLVLMFLDEDEVLACIAHELAHQKCENADALASYSRILAMATSYNQSIYAVEQAEREHEIQKQMNMQARGHAGVWPPDGWRSGSEPISWMYRNFLGYYLVWRARLIRRQISDRQVELQCDKLAAEAVGTSVFISALKKMAAVTIVAVECKDAIHRENPPENIQIWTDIANLLTRRFGNIIECTRNAPASIDARIVLAVMKIDSGAHPSIVERVAYLGGSIYLERMPLPQNTIMSTKETSVLWSSVLAARARELQGILGLELLDPAFGEFMGHGRAFAFCGLDMDTASDMIEEIAPFTAVPIESENPGQNARMRRLRRRYH